MVCRMILFKVLPILLTLIHLYHVYAQYYACPPTSLCVPPSYCKPENITFNPADENFLSKYEQKHVCGVLPECEGNICCNDPVGLPDEHQPNKTHWCYRENTEGAPEMDFTVPVYPYPGLDDPVKTGEVILQILICPAASVCILGISCPRSLITFSYGLSEIETYTCGSHSETVGFVCCALTTTTDEWLPVTEDNGKPAFMKESWVDDTSNYNDGYEKKWSYRNSDYATSVEGISLKEEKFYQEMSGKSANIQEWACGRTLSISGQLQRIYAPIGDREANEGDFPWHVAVLSSTYEYLCSGVIVDEKVVITIAHCFHKHNYPNDVLVRVGDLNLKEETEKNPAFDVRVKHLVIHPEYDPIKLEADIAVIELEESVRGLTHVRPACLPGSGFSPAINKCKVPGWGQYSKSKEEKNEFNYGLRVASFYEIDKTQCQNSLRKVKELGAFFKLQKNVLCAKGYSNADTCKGDGGSGLVCRDKTDVYVLQGLVSYGFGCGYDLPGVYTDIRKYLEFIKNYKTYLPGGKNDPKNIYKDAKIGFSRDENIYRNPVKKDEIYKQDSNIYSSLQSSDQYSYISSDEESSRPINRDYFPELPAKHYSSSKHSAELKEPEYSNEIYKDEELIPVYKPKPSVYPPIKVQNEYQEEPQSYDQLGSSDEEDSTYTSYESDSDGTRTKFGSSDLPHGSGYEKIQSDFLPPIQDYNRPPKAEYSSPPIQDYDRPPKAEFSSPFIHDYDGPPKSEYSPPIQGYDRPKPEYSQPPIQNYNRPPKSEYSPPIQDYDRSPKPEYSQPPIQNYDRPPRLEYSQPPIQDYDRPPKSEYSPPIQDYDRPPKPEYSQPPIQNYDRPPKSEYSPSIQDYDRPPKPEYSQPPIQNYDRPPKPEYSQPPIQDYARPPKSEYSPSIQDYDRPPKPEYSQPPIQNYDRPPKPEYPPLENYDHESELDYGSYIDEYDRAHPSDYLPYIENYDRTPDPDYLPSINNYQAPNLDSDETYPTNGYSNFDIDLPEKYNDINYDYIKIEPYKKQDLPREYPKPDVYNIHGENYKRKTYEYKPNGQTYEPEYLPNEYVGPDKDYKPSRSNEEPDYRPHNYRESNNYEASISPYESDYPSNKYEFIIPNDNYKPNKYSYDKETRYRPHDYTRFYDDEQRIDPHKRDYDSNNDYPDVPYYDDDYPHKRDYDSNNDYPDVTYYDDDDYPTKYRFDHADYDSLEHYGDRYYNDLRDSKYGPNVEQHSRHITPKNRKLKSVKRLISKIPESYSSILNTFAQDIDSAPEITIGKVRSPISLLYKKV